MENKPVNLCKVTLMVSRVPQEVVLDVFKAIGIEKMNTYLIKAINDGKPNPTWQALPKSKMITKANLSRVSPCFRLSDSICTTWCLESDLEKAKEACMDKMQWATRQMVERAIGMSRIFQEYKSKQKK